MHDLYVPSALRLEDFKDADCVHKLERRVQ